MKPEELTIAEAKQRIAEADELRAVLGGNPRSGGSSRWRVGQNYFIRTVTHHILGKLEEVTDHELWLSSVSWIADDGRFSECLANGTANEVEPAPEGDVAVGRGSIVDAYHWSHTLLREVK